MFSILHHRPCAVSHSPALTLASSPTIVASSRRPSILTRSTVNPVSSLWKVTRSIRPEAASSGREEEVPSVTRKDWSIFVLLNLAPQGPPCCAVFKLLQFFLSDNEIIDLVREICTSVVQKE